MKTTTFFTCSLITALAIPTGLVANSSTISTAPSREVAAKLKDIRAQKREIAGHLDSLHQRLGNPFIIAFQAHVADLNLVREKINRLGSELNRLEANASLAPVHKATVSEIRSFLVPVSSGVEEMVRKLNENQLAFRTPAYHRMVGSTARQAAESSVAVRRSVELALNGSGASSSETSTF